MCRKAWRAGTSRWAHGRLTPVPARGRPPRPNLVLPGAALAMDVGAVAADEASPAVDLLRLREVDRLLRRRQQHFHWHIEPRVLMKQLSERHPPVYKTVLMTPAGCCSTAGRRYCCATDGQDAPPFCTSRRPPAAHCFLRAVGWARAGARRPSSKTYPP